MYLNIKLQDVTYSQSRLVEALESPTQIAVGIVQFLVFHT
jgi:hypothetical protein